MDAIQRYDLGRRLHEGAFEGIVQLAAQICHCPIALVSIVHQEDQRFEARCGLNLWSTGLDASICSHAILQDDILEIPDCREDMRTRDNPLVTDPADPLLFYAGAQIMTPDGVALGSLCVLDRRPRRLGDSERQGLRILADQVMRRLELHEALRQQDALRREVDHRVKNSLASVAVLTRMAARAAQNEETRSLLASVERRIQVMVELHADLYKSDDLDARVAIQDYLVRIAGHLESVAPPKVRIISDFAPLEMASNRASAVGLVINEMVSNACKHAFPNGDAGEIVLTGKALNNDRYAVTCEDNGRGLMVAKNGAMGLGSRIMKASAAQLDGTLTLESRDTGFLGRLEFPVAWT
ncbi:MAG: histidine kinase dimerization/phosphoacceptor domain -containing protein [Pseudomonadota bacterium]